MLDTKVHPSTFQNLQTTVEKLYSQCFITNYNEFKKEKRTGIQLNKSLNALINVAVKKKLFFLHRYEILV